MENSNWDTMNDEQFDALLAGSLPELPPDPIAEAVTPWKQATNRILIGLALTSITLNFLLLQYLLPAIGSVLLLLGFRTLRAENRWFGCCFAATALRTLCFLTFLLLNSTILASLDGIAALTRFLTSLFLLLLFFVCFCLWRGLLALQRKAGLPARAPGAAWLLVWYGLVCVLALLQYQGIVFGLLMAAGYISILLSLRRLAGDLAESGYAIRTTPIRMTDRRLILSLCAALLVGMACGYAFGGTYSMDWTPAEESGNEEVSEVRSHLLELGFPEEVLKDLTEDDILACAGATQVVSDVSELPVNDGRTVTTRTETESGSLVSTDTVYDTKELRVTGVAVKIPGERERWMIFHHFCWTQDPGYWGTESIQLWPTWQNLEEGWSPADELTGRVLCDRDGQTFSTPYTFLGTQNWQQSSPFWGQEARSDPFAAFSFPRKADNRRCYLAYGVWSNAPGWILDSWANYTHQRTWLQYPVRTAMEHRMTNSLAPAGAFVTVQDALQFYPGDTSSLNPHHVSVAGTEEQVSVLPPE